MTTLRSILFFALCACLPLGAGLAQDSQAVGKTYRVGSNFLRAISGDGAAAGASDPFAAEEPKSDEPVKNIQQILEEELGIQFPQGTFARFDPRTGRLEIHHLPAVVEAIEAYFAALNPGQQTLAMRVEIFQLPARVALKLQQFCGPLDDHSAAWQSVMTMIERGEASLVTTVSVTARSGQRARAQKIQEVIYHTEIDWDDDDETIVPAAFETRNSGTVFEVDPILGADDFTIDVNLDLEHHTAPPTMRSIAVTSPKSGRKVVTEFPEFHVSKITTQIVTRDGAMKLLGAWRPTGKPEFEKADVMQVAFLKIDVVTERTVVPVVPGGAAPK